MTPARKLIEVALPLDAINAASAREKSIRHGHPSTLHLWWARRPLAAARAVIFAQMVDDPSEYVDVLLSDPAKKRAAQRELNKGHGDSALGAVPHVADSSAKVGLYGGTRQALEEMLAQLERERLFKIMEDLVRWGEHDQRGSSGAGAFGDMAELATSLRAQRRPSSGERSCLTGTNCRHFTTRSRAVALCPWRRSVWGWRRTPRT